MIRTKAILAVAGLFAATAPALADESKNLIPGEFSANVAFASDYVFRGISQTGTDPAVQAGLDWSHAGGVYLGVWGSNVDFGTDANSEIDWAVGFANEAAGIGYDLKLVYYSYPGAAKSLDYDFWEATVALGYEVGSVAFGVGYSYSPAFFGDSGQAHYVGGNVAVAVPEAPLGLTLSAAIGRQYIADNARWGTPDYTDWRIAAGIGVDGFDLSLAYTATDLGRAECGGTNLCDGRVVFSVGRAL